MPGEGVSNNVINLEEERKKRKDSAEGSRNFFMSVMTSIVSFIQNGVEIVFFNSKKQPTVSGVVQSVSPDRQSVTVRTPSGKTQVVKVGDFKPGGDIRVTTGQRKQN